MSPSSVQIPSATTSIYHCNRWYHGWYTALASWVVDVLVAISSKGRGERDLKSLFLRTTCRGFLSPACARYVGVERRPK